MSLFYQAMNYQKIVYFYCIKAILSQRDARCLPFLKSFESPEKDGMTVKGNQIIQKKGLAPCAQIARIL